VNLRTFFAELKRRNVYKVAIAYAIVGWLRIQVATQVFPFFEIPNWGVRLIVLFIVIGFPVALILAWAFELTPEGIKRTEVADSAPTRRPHNRAWIYVVVIAGSISVGLFFLGRYTAPTKLGGSANAAAKSIAVLPFENLSHDPDNSYFADGIQEEILTRLAKIADLKVISRTSTQHYKSAPENLPEIAKQLGVVQSQKRKHESSGVFCAAIEGGIGLSLGRLLAATAARVLPKITSTNMIEAATARKQAQLATRCAVEVVSNTP
jgi:hypothetical protein